eukprot:Plantae.Rhodophyta-Hildenbrandia_rubra.ctg20301.p2 GENE.Plantae.Rhodophyta-Hildenbrandia_rubra.ctg20301~~Plantae.Rhodophyta-Hildenbrandia_rubra.ctg20301.p2  ORF type:complete len:160 (+),score=32.85 Plantae.Rhodophyta-Hildenbrandia_rubra.ctg20301:817-1296(+)
MILSLVLVSYEAGGVIFSRFYGKDFRTEQAQAAWLKKLRDATAPDWRLLKEDGPEQVATIGAVQIMYKLIGDIVAIFAGNQEHDALLMLELARSFEKCIRRACGIRENKEGETRVSAERKLLQKYWMLCLIVDELIDDGQIDHLDPKAVVKLINMRPTR